MGSKIVVLGTGGTIAGTAAVPGDNIGYTAAQVGVAQLLAAIPGLARPTLEVEQVVQLDSKDMSFAIWTQLALRCAHWLSQDEVQGVVITHGSDTLEETAYFLQAVLHPVKPVVLTCAMRPTTALVPDGPQNLLDAMSVAAWPGARGVVAVCAGVIHGAQDVQKIHPYRLDAFGSGDAGPIGYIEESTVRCVRNWPEPGETEAVQAAQIIEAVSVWPRVDILMNHVGASGALVDALMVQASAASNPLAGLVVACTGNGTLHHDLEAALLRAQAAGVRVVRATRCAQGRVLGKSGDLFPDSDGLTPVKARIALMLSLLGFPGRSTEPPIQASGC